MRQTISGLVAALAMVAASAAPAMACGWASPCAQTYVPVYSGCNTGCGGWSYRERLPDPVQQYGAAPMASPQYYYVDQGPTYAGPGAFAPYKAYQEGAYHHRYDYNGYHHGPHHYGHHGMRYGYGRGPHRYGYAHHYGYREHVLRRYY